MFFASDEHTAELCVKIFGVLSAFAAWVALYWFTIDSLKKHLSFNAVRRLVWFVPTLMVFPVLWAISFIIKSADHFGDFVEATGLGFGVVFASWIIVSIVLWIIQIFSVDDNSLSESGDSRYFTAPLTILGIGAGLLFWQQVLDLLFFLNKP